MAKKQSDISNAQKLGLGVGLTAAAVAAAGAYFLYGSKDAPKNRKKVKGWALKAKGEVLETLENTKKMTEGEFNTLVENAAKMYSGAKKLSKKELSDFKAEMSENWQELVASGAAKVIKAVAESKKAPAKKAPAKKAAKKAPAAKKTAAKKAPAKKAAAKKTAGK